MTEWASLRDAYGFAEQVPVLLAAAEASGTDENDCWTDLWSRLCHQGTVYSASYAALPALAGMSVRHEPSGYTAALHLAASIIASTDGPEDPAVVRLRYQQELADLQTVAIRNLPYAKDDTEFIYGLQTLLAFQDAGVWQRNLHLLANGEAEFECPSCGEDLLADLDGPDFTVESFTDGSLLATVIAPAQPSNTTIEARILTLTQANNRPTVTDRLTYLFGDLTCPRCNTMFPLSQTLT